MGFFRYQGLPIEHVAAAWLRSQIIMPTRLHFRAKNERLEQLRESTKTRKTSATKKTTKRKMTVDMKKERRKLSRHGKPPQHGKTQRFTKKNRHHGKEST